MKIRTLVFFSQKGGSGKTTLAVHIGATASEHGERVFIADTDRQRTATSWGEARGDKAPNVITIAANELTAVQVAARQDKMSLCIVDTAPHAAPEAAQIVRLADLVVIPCRPTAFDLAAVSSAVDIVSAAKARAAFVLSACPFRAPEIEEAREALAPYGFPIAPIPIIERRAYARAVATGRAVTEFDKEGKAAEEIRNLWTWIKGMMDG